MYDTSFVKKKRNPFTQDCFVSSLIAIDPVVLKHKIFTYFECIFAVISL